MSISFCVEAGKNSTVFLAKHSTSSRRIWSTSLTDSTVALERVSAMVWSFPGTCLNSGPNRMSLSLKRSTLGGIFERSFVVNNGTRGLWSVSTRNGKPRT